MDQELPLTGDLFEFAYLGDFVEQLKALAASAQSEDWDYRDAHTGKLPILNNYIRYTYKRLVEEGKVAFGELDTSGRVAAFNTGLFTPHYQTIFACFVENEIPDRQPWFLRGWFTENERIMRSFSQEAPQPARYFDRPAELVFDPDLPIVANLEHILDDNADRFPADLQDRAHQRRLILDGAIRDAAKRVQTNYKLAVPQYYFGRGGGQPGRMQLLLPLALIEPGRTDLALVVDRDDKCYRAFTVLPLRFAYKNARLIARPDADWLAPMGVPDPEEDEV